MGEAPSTKTVVGPLPSARRSNLSIVSPSRPRGPPDKLVLSSPVQSMKWDHLLADTSVPDLDTLCDQIIYIQIYDTITTGLYVNP